jgi:ubiquinone/menaquinone biosynthesis C-methylase UbiE
LFGFQYDHDQTKSGSFGQDHIAKKLLDLGVKKTAKILDVCGGTGRVARRVRRTGVKLYLKIFIIILFRQISYAIDG